MAGAGSRSGERKAHILQAFATMLEQHPGGRITTAALAREVGVSEAALYRHFASKAQMFEGLISFLEETVLGRVPAIKQELSQAPERCGALLTVLLSFCAKNPGFARLPRGTCWQVKRSAFGSAWPSSLSASKRSFGSLFGTGARPRPAHPAPCNPLRQPYAGRRRRAHCGFVRGGFEPTPLEHWPHRWQTLAEACLTPQPPT